MSGKGGSAWLRPPARLPPVCSPWKGVASRGYRRTLFSTPLGSNSSRPRVTFMGYLILPRFTEYLVIFLFVCFNSKSLFLLSGTERSLAWRQSFLLTGTSFRPRTTLHTVGVAFDLKSFWQFALALFIQSPGYAS